jgi:hypothetical protein
MSDDEITAGRLAQLLGVTRKTIAELAKAELTRKRDEFMKKLSSDPRFRKSEARGDAYIIVGYPKP